MRRSILSLFTVLVLTGCGLVQSVQLPSVLAPAISRDRAEAIALDIASKGMPEIDVIQPNPKVVDAQLTTYAKAEAILSPGGWTNPEVQDPNEAVWLVTLEGTWQDAFPIPETTPNPPREKFDRGRILISAKTGGFLASSFYPSQASPQPPGKSPDPTATRLEPQASSTSTGPAASGPVSTPVAADLFPLAPGTAWTYTRTGYSQVDNHPDQLIHGTSQTVEIVADVQTAPTAVILHIRGQKSMLQADPGWQENGRFPLGNYEYWYVFQDNSLYLSSSHPDPDHLEPLQMLEEYHFPMAIGASWCPEKMDRGSLTPPAETPVPCEYAGKRTVVQAGNYHSPAGQFDRCYQLQDQYNSGGVVQWFCAGAGRVAEKYDHAGTRFGYSEELTAFSTPSQK